MGGTESLAELFGGGKVSHVGASFHFWPPGTGTLKWDPVDEGMLLATSACVTR